MNNLENLVSTKELQEIDARHHIHPFTDTAHLNKVGAKVIVRGNGVFLFDNEGKEYLDAMSGLWCVNIGYGRNELGEAARKQMNNLPYYNTFFGTTHPPVIRLSEKLSSLTPPNLNKIFFSSSGSEANDTNIRLVRHYWTCLGKPDKKVIVSRQNAYHGSSLGSGSLGGMQSMHAQGGMPIPDIIHINQPYWYGEAGAMAEDEFGIARAKELEEKICEIGVERIAAFIAEPIQGAGGVIIPPKSYWPEVSRICKEYDILLIADEVICGFGRTGSWFGSESFKIEPDLMTVAKGLSSGYQPIGGSIVSDKIASVLEQYGGEFCHGYTYSGHPVAAAVALENLRIIEDEGLVSKVENDIGPYIADKWKQLSDHPMVGEARIFGMLGALELTPEASSRASFAAPEGTVGLITREISIENGLIMRHVGDKMIISPPLTISRKQVDKLIDLVWLSLDKSEKKVSAKGLMKIGTRRT